MIRLLAIILIVVGSSFGSVWNLNGDCVVNLGDFAVIAAGWQTTYDIDDLASFAADWLETVPGCACEAPTVTGDSFSLADYKKGYITLSANDDGYPTPSRLDCIITDLPVGNAVLQDPARGTGLITKVPYKLAAHGKQVLFWSKGAGSYNFKFKANDRLQDSSEATISVTTTANPKDKIEFDGKGYLTIADNALENASTMVETGDLNNPYVAGTFNADFNNEFAFCCYIRTEHPNGTIFEKGGVKFMLKGGKPLLVLTDSSNTKYGLRLNSRIDDGSWVLVGFSFTNDPAFYTSGNHYVEVIAVDYGTNQGFATLQAGFESDESAKIGNKFKGSVDRIFWINDYAVSGLNTTFSDDMTAYDLAGRQSTGYGMLVAFGMTPHLEWHCNEASGSSAASLEGYSSFRLNANVPASFSSTEHVDWQMVQDFIKVLE